MHLSYLHCESKVTDFKLPINSTLQWKTVPSFYSCPITFNDSPLLSSHFIAIAAFASLATKEMA